METARLRARDAGLKWGIMLDSETQEYQSRNHKNSSWVLRNIVQAAGEG